MGFREILRKAQANSPSLLLNSRPDALLVAGFAHDVARQRTDLHVGVSSSGIPVTTSDRPASLTWFLSRERRNAAPHNALPFVSTLSPFSTMKNQSHVTRLNLSEVEGRVLLLSGGRGEEHGGTRVTMQQLVRTLPRKLQARKIELSFAILIKVHHAAVARGWGQVRQRCGYDLSATPGVLPHSSRSRPPLPRVSPGATTPCLFPPPCFSAPCGKSCITYRRIPVICRNVFVIHVMDSGEAGRFRGKQTTNSPPPPVSSNNYNS